MSHQKNSHCSYCGAAFPSPALKYAKCEACGNQTWVSPMPVSVLILPVIGDDGRIGVLIARRGIEPAKGQWGLPGGYLEQDETLECGAVRENGEETTVKLPPDWPVWLTHSGISTRAVKQVIAFCEAKPIPISMLPDPFVPRDAETEAIMVVYDPIELCFSTHTEALKLYFDRLHAPKTR